MLTRGEGIRHPCYSKLKLQIVGRELVLVFGQEHLGLNLVCLFFIAALMFSTDEVNSYAIVFIFKYYLEMT